MAMRKENRKYFFSVEGETERWYLEWLRQTINAEPSARYIVKLNCAVQNPLKYAKMQNIGGIEITHIFDYESKEPRHVKEFQQTLGYMRKAQIEKNVTYKLGYSNFTFELWMILHKMDCNGCLTHRNQYLSKIREAYQENFENLDQYKQEKNFKCILSKLTLDNVRDAIKRAECIMQRNKENGFVLQKYEKYKKYEYYNENPSLSVWECIKNILDECCPKG